MVYIKDDQMPHGITEMSVEFVKKNLERLGRPQSVVITKVASLDWVTEIVGSRGEIVTDGFSTGYSGEGPTGLRTVLELLGIEPIPAPSEVALADEGKLKERQFVWKARPKYTLLISKS